jgi:hypothetical protein
VITGLDRGEYEIRCEDKVIGTATREALATGVNLNSLLLASDHEAPWARLAKAFWDGQMLDQIGHTRWRFVVRKRE